MPVDGASASVDNRAEHLLRPEGGRTALGVKAEMRSSAGIQAGRLLVRMRGEAVGFRDLGVF